jgi:hypothetical protein
MLSFKDKLLLLRNYLDLYANPHKNRVFQFKKTLAEENKEKDAEMRRAKKKQQQIEKDQRDKRLGDTGTNSPPLLNAAQNSPKMNKAKS